MQIKEVMRGSDISIAIEINGEEFLFNTKVVFGMKTDLMVEPILYRNIPIEVHKPTRVNVLNLRDGRNYTFHADEIVPTQTDYGIKHLIRCREDAEPANRRLAQRLDILTMGTVRAGAVKDNVIIHDISMNGISFILNESHSFKIGDTVNITFIVGETFHTYEVEAEIVRFFDHQRRRAAGCRIHHTPLDLITLINHMKESVAG